MTWQQRFWSNCWAPIHSTTVLPCPLNVPQPIWSTLPGTTATPDQTDCQPATGAGTSYRKYAEKRLENNGNAYPRDTVAGGLNSGIIDTANTLVKCYQVCDDDVTCKSLSFRPATGAKGVSCILGSTTKIDTSAIQTQVSFTHYTQDSNCQSGYSAKYCDNAAVITRLRERSLACDSKQQLEPGKHAKSSFSFNI